MLSDNWDKRWERSASVQGSNKKRAPSPGRKLLAMCNLGGMEERMHNQVKRRVQLHNSNCPCLHITEMCANKGKGLNLGNEFLHTKHPLPTTAKGARFGNGNVPLYLCQTTSMQTDKAGNHLVTVSFSRRKQRTRNPPFRTAISQQTSGRIKEKKFQEETGKEREKSS